jgi:hypothetical protein
MQFQKVSKLTITVLKGVEVDEDGFEKVAKLMNTVSKVSKLANMVLKGLKADKHSSKKVQSGKTHFDNHIFKRFGI